MDRIPAIDLPSRTPAPRRQRSRWLIAVLIILSVATWWLWPSADPRFVGRWEAYNSNRSLSQPVCIFERFPNGRGRTTFMDGTGPDDFFWSVDGDHFRSSLIAGPVWQTMFRQMFARLWMKLSRNPAFPGVSDLRIEKVDENEIRMRREDDGDWIIHRRAAR
jgi:hypothetical protein